MSDGTAFSSDNTEVLTAWREYQAKHEDVIARRLALVERFGRRLYIARNGFSHGDYVVGFERIDDLEQPGDYLHHKLLYVAKAGHQSGMVIPNIRRRAGKDLRAEMGALRTEGPALPGMPTFTIAGDGFGMHSHAPALHLDGDTVWAFWNTEMSASPGGEKGHVDSDRWQEQPLSSYYAAKERFEAEHPSPGAAS